MLSAKFVGVIQSSADVISHSALQELHRDPRAAHISHLPDSELNHNFRSILLSFDNWLQTARKEEIARNYEEIGRIRLREHIPLHESIHALHLLKECMLRHIRSQGLAQNSMDFYEEEELEHQTGLFFDAIVYHVIRGYEGQMQRAATA